MDAQVDPPPSAKFGIVARGRSSAASNPDREARVFEWTTGARATDARAMSTVFVEGERDMPAMKLPLRTTLLDLGSSRVLLSPASTLTDEQLLAMEGVTDIVATNLYHLDGVPRAARLHPTAKVWAPAGASAKLPAIGATGTLGEEPLPFAGLVHVVLEGMPKIEESVFYEEATRTLYVTDLFFNVERAKGIAAWLVYSLFGTYERFGTSRLFTAAVKDAARFRASIAKVLALDVSRIVPAHGAIVDVDANAKMRRALAERGY